MSVPDIQNALELLRQRDVDAAISSLKQKVEEIPAHLTAHVLLARAHEAKRDWSMALQSWENAHFLMPNSPIVTSGKERVINRINEEEDTAPTSSDPATPASRGDASPSTKPPEPQAPPSPTNSKASAELEAAEKTSKSSSASTDSAATDSAAKDSAAMETTDTASGSHESDANTSSEANPVTQQAQALLHDTSTSQSDTDDPEPSPDVTGRTPQDASQQSASQQPESRYRASRQEEPQPEEEAQSTEAKESTDRIADASETSDDTSDRSTTQSTSPPDQLQKVVGQFANTEDDDSAAEIKTSRRPDTTSYRPDTAIIDAAASLLNQGPTPAAQDASTDAEDQHTASSKASSQNQDEREASSTGDRTAEPDTATDARRGNAKSADAFIPDFASRSTASTTDTGKTESKTAESKQEDSKQEDSKQEDSKQTESKQTDPARAKSSQDPSDADDSRTGRADTYETREEENASAEQSQQASYDAYDIPESHLLDKLGPPPDARSPREEGTQQQEDRTESTSKNTPTGKEPTVDASPAMGASSPIVEPPSPDTSFSQPPLTNPRSGSGQTLSGQETPSQEPSKEKKSRLDIPTPTDLLPSDIPHRQQDTASAPDSTGSEDSSADDAATDDETDGLSELEKLRRSAEQEARQGGARPGLRQQLQNQSATEKTPSGKTDDTIGDLDQLIQDLESARIQPRPDLDELPTPNLEDDVEDLVSETLARIYAAQSQYREAARIYVKLASQEPANARNHLENASDMREKAEKKEAEERAAKANNE